MMEGVSQEDIAPGALTQLQRNVVVLQDEINDYRKDCGDKFYAFFFSVAQAVNDLDDGFYVDLYGHVDATKTMDFRELLRSKMATLYKSEFRTDVLGRDRHGTMRYKPLGLLGGAEKIRSVLGEATKQDELLKKTLVKRSRKQKSGPSRRDARSRYRSRYPLSGKHKSKNVYRYKSSKGR